MTDIYAVQSATETAYEVHIPVFEGPLDLLLRLIEKNELDITRIALAQVTDEFMEHVDQMRANMQIEVIADFLFVAAKLLWIKSRALLPKPAASAREEVEDADVGDELIRQLRAYRQYKEAAGWLRDRDAANLRSYVRAGYQPRPRRVTLDLSGESPEGLRAMVETLLFPNEAPRPEAAIQRPRISIQEQITLIRTQLLQWTRVTFHRLLSRQPSRLEAVVTLQAILELVKQQLLVAHQEEMFGDITLKALVPPEQITTSTASPPAIAD
ncbi:MAG: segregation and condensation protein A [Anaerolineae bacterium]